MSVRPETMRKVNLAVCYRRTPRATKHRPIETIWGKSQGFIYFITAGDDPEWVKIGFTTGAPSARLRSLQTGCPLKLRLLGAISAPSAAEAEIHDVLRDERGIGEWFRITPYVERLIADELAMEAD